MSRIETIARITARLASLDDERLKAVAEIVEASAPIRDLSERERGLLAQSKADFKAGRYHTLDEVVDFVDAELAALGVPRSRK